MEKENVTGVCGDELEKKKRNFAGVSLPPPCFPRRRVSDGADFLSLLSNTTQETR